MLSAGNPRHNESGTLLEGIAIWGERKKDLPRQVLVENAVEAVLWEFAHGVQFIRTHADTTDPTLGTVDALVAVKDRMKDLVEIQIVAFPQDGVFTTPSGETLLRRALDRGADVVGGIPHNEFTREDGVRSVELAFELAEAYDVPIDLHCDETGDDQSRFVEVMAKLAITTGMWPRVTASHTTAMHNYHNDYAAKLLGMAKRANMNFITNPSTTRCSEPHGGLPAPGHTWVDEMVARGECLHRPRLHHGSLVSPGKGPCSRRAPAAAAHMSGHQIGALFDMITVNTARTSWWKTAGASGRKPANLVVFDAENEFDALRRKAIASSWCAGGRGPPGNPPAGPRLPRVRKDVDFRIPGR